MATPYPPRVGAPCTDPVCCAQGRKFIWPELQGKNVQEAKATIQRDNKFVTVVLVNPGMVGFADFCCNRVYLVVDQNQMITNIPVIG